MRIYKTTFNFELFFVLENQGFTGRKLNCVDWNQSGSRRLHSVGGWV